MKKENQGTKQELFAWRIEIAIDQLDGRAGASLGRSTATARAAS